MPTPSEELVAYLATLLALVLLIIVAMLIGAHYPLILGKVEIFGLGTVTGGLIGLMRIPRSKAVDGEPLLRVSGAALGPDESGNTNKSE